MGTATPRSSSAVPRARAVRTTLPSPREATSTLVTAGAAALLVAAAALAYGDDRSAVPGLPDPGVLTAWGLPLARAVAQLGAALVVGTTLAAAFGGPAFHRRIARRAGAVWTAASVAVWLFTLSDLRGVPVPGILDADGLWTLGLHTSVGRAGLATVVLAAATTALCRRTPGIALLTGVLGGLPLVFVGVEVATADHRTAVAAALFQAAALTLTSGALAALLLRAAREGGAPLVTAATRYGRLATVGVATLGAATVLSAFLVLGPSDTGLDSAYGHLVALLLLAVGGLIAAGRWRTTQTVPALARGRTDPFLRFATLELLLFAGATGLTVALTRVPAPLDSGAGVHHESAGVQMIGYDLPPAVSFPQLATDWRPDLPFLLLCAAGAYGYLRLRVRAGGGARWRRDAAWFAGLAAIAVATSSGVGRYAPVFFSVTIVQHVLLGIVAPLLLTSAAPLTLALRTLPADGPREWLLAALRSRVAVALTHPVAVVVLWSAGLAATYFTGLFEATRWSYAADLGVQAWLLGTGLLLFWWLTGPDPRPAGCRANRTRALIALTAAAAGTAVGAVLIAMPGVVAADWYIGLLRVLRLPFPWGSVSVRDDQSVGGALLVASSAVVFLAVAADRAAAGISGRHRRESGDHDRPGAAAR